MRIAFLADIHGNLEAFDACLASVRQHGADRIVVLGDIVGYGADPEACVERIRQASANGALAVMGNHDQGALGAGPRLNEDAAAALRWTRAVLGAAARDMLQALPMAIEDEDRLYVHASAANPGAFPYVTDCDTASASLGATKARLTFVGHAHVCQLYTISAVGKLQSFTPTPEVAIPLAKQRRWLAVIGSVGQPRDGNPAAAWGLLDTDANELTYRRVPYDIDKAAAKIRAAGLPAALWKRLNAGK